MTVQERKPKRSMQAVSALRQQQQKVFFQILISSKFVVIKMNYFWGILNEIECESNSVISVDDSSTKEI